MWEKMNVPYPVRTCICSRIHILFTLVLFTIDWLSYIFLYVNTKHGGYNFPWHSQCLAVQFHYFDPNNKNMCFLRHQISMNYQQLQHWQQKSSHYGNIILRAINNQRPKILQDEWSGRLYVWCRKLSQITPPTCDGNYSLQIQCYYWRYLLMVSRKRNQN